MNKHLTGLYSTDYGKPIQKKNGLGQVFTQPASPSELEVFLEFHRLGNPNRGVFMENEEGDMMSLSLDDASVDSSFDGSYS